MNTYNLSQFYEPNARIANLDPLSDEAIWPHNIELCITRIPIRKRDGYTAEMIKTFAEKLKGCMVQNGIAFLVCYAPVECKHRPFEIAKTMSDAGFHHVDNIVIKKTWFPGKRSEINLVNSHEYVLYFCNGKVWNLDRLPIKKYLKQGDDSSCIGNTWEVTTGSLDENISSDLASLLMKMTDSLPGSVIIDPFMGNASTLQASLNLGHSFFGFEQDKRRLKKYDKILDNFKKGK